MPHDVPVHISELATVALVDDKDNLLVLIGVHHFFVLRALYGVCHLLHRGDDKLPVLILHLADKDIRAICHVNRASFKLVKLFRLSENPSLFRSTRKMTFLMFGFAARDLRRLKGCQRVLPAPVVCQNIRIPVCEGVA